MGRARCGVALTRGGVCTCVVWMRLNRGFFDLVSRRCFFATTAMNCLFASKVLSKMVCIILEAIV